ncbi:hypothetical protein RKD05_002771 [Microbacterium sp. SLBN-111]
MKLSDKWETRPGPHFAASQPNATSTLGAYPKGSPVIPGSAHRPSRPLLAIAVLAVAGAALSGCATAAAPAGPASTIPLADDASILTDVCPATVVVQATWEPEVDHGPFYGLVGPDAVIDADKKSVTGTLVDQGKSTGVQIEVRSGGSAIGYQPVASQMYTDTSITLGSVPTEDRVAGAESQPTIGVFATRQQSPQMIMWDPQTHPDWTSIADIGKTDATVVVPKGGLYAQALVAKGVLKQSQLSDSYDGSPARFVSDPSIAQNGFATSEPYIYEHEISQWDKPVKYQLVKDAGYDVYPDALSIRSADLEKLSPCLTKLVPILQRSALAYLADPAPTNALIVKLVEEYDTGWVYSPGVAEAGAGILKNLHLMAGTDPSVPIGDFAPARAKNSFDQVTSLLGATGVKIDPALTPDDIFDDQFIDPSITSK